MLWSNILSFLFKVAVGSVPPNFSPKLLECEERPWKKENFQITFLQRVQSTASSRFSEQRLVVSFRLSKMMIWFLYSFFSGLIENTIAFFNSNLTWFCIQFRPLPQRWRLITCCYTRRLVKDVQYGAHARAVDWRWQLKWRQDQLSKGNQMCNHVLRNSWLTLYLASVPPNSIRTDEHLLVLRRIQTNMPNLI